MGEPCRTIAIAEEVCYLRFAEGQVHHSGELSHETARGELLIADFDAEGRILGIELVGPPGQKPCQG
jgi:uncharacterized protein YuzE